VVAFHRWLDHGVKDDVVVVASFTSKAFEEGYRIGLPAGGRWVIRFNADWKGYSPDFDGVGEYQGVTDVTNEPRDGFEFSGAVPLAPYGFLILSREEEPAKENGGPAPAGQP
jgi:1,4-alpha-glucan branching enzyme